MNLLIIEDDQVLAQKIAYTFLQTGNYNDIKIANSYIGFKQFYHIIESFDIVLVDIFLSDNYCDINNGIKVLKKIRRKSKTIPVIIISSIQDIEWIEQGFINGANDYLTKPFRLKELELRVDRWFRMFLYDRLKIKDNLEYKGLKKDLLSGEYFYKDKKLDLTKKSKYILGLFMNDPEKILTEEFLVDKIWGDISYVIERNPRVNISRLKKSLEVFGIDNRIENVRGEGYRLKKN